MRRLSIGGLLVTLAVAGCAEVRQPHRQVAQRGGSVEFEQLVSAAGDGPSRGSTATDWFLAADTPAGRAAARRAADEADLPAQEQLDATDSAAEGPAHASRSRAPLPGLWETIQRDLAEAPADLWEDTRSVYGDGRNLVILGLTYGGSLAMQSTGVDDRFESSFNSRRVFKEDISDGLGFLGNPGTHFGLAGLWYLVGQQRQDERTYSVGRALFSALTINGLTTMLGQAATSDRSPNGEWGTFPSGHTSSTFTFASVMHEAYGPWVGVPLYALGAAVATERMDDGEHYASDVLMGAVMGLVIGHTVAGEHELELLGGRIVPYADPYTGASGIAWHLQF